MEELKPCPFCGSEEIDPSEARGKKLDGTMTIAAGCIDCGALGPVAIVRSETGYKESLKAWNTRHSDI